MQLANTKYESQGIASQLCNVHNPTPHKGLRPPLNLKGNLLSLFGVCAVLDHESTALSAISDAVVALSCKAIKADVAVVEDCPSFQRVLVILRKNK
nr:histidine--trna ligase, cytoplasmic [Quercus suber]